MELLYIVQKNCSPYRLLTDVLTDVEWFEKTIKTCLIAMIEATGDLQEQDGSQGFSTRS